MTTVQPLPSRPLAPEPSALPASASDSDDGAFAPVQASTLTSESLPLPM